MMTLMDCSLAGVPLTPQQLTALARSGVVSAERHGRGMRYRLRFRMEGRQVAISLGADAGRAEMVRTAVAEVQAPRRAARDFLDRLDAARKSRRRIKLILYNRILELGLTWHGLMFRRPRNSSGASLWAGLNSRGCSLIHKEDSMSQNLTNGDQPHSGPAKPRKVFRPPAKLKVAVADDDSPVPAEVCEVPPNVGPAASAQNGAADSTSAPVGPRNWAQELAAQAQKCRNPLAGLFFQLCADSYQSACDVDTAEKTLLRATSNPMAAFKIVCAANHQKALVHKQLRTLGKEADEFQRMDREPLRGPYTSVVTGEKGMLR